MTKVEPLSKFEYQPLDPDQPTAIRIFVLKRSRGSGNDLIESSIFHTELKNHSDSVKYEALSYEWKEASVDDSIILVHDCRFLIRKNLYDALMQLRLADKDRYLWIDALCINQEDHIERNRQVHMMQSIYKKAQRVILWLGPAKDDSDLAIEILESMKATHMEERQIVECQTRSRKEWRAALLAFCQRSYWHRVWIMQEICLGQDYIVHCGSMSISGNTFDKCFKDLATSRNHGDDWNYMIHRTLAVRHITMFRYWAQRNQLFRLGRCLDFCLDGFIATEPRDFIYGIRGIASDCGTDELVPNYEISLKALFFDSIPILARAYSSPVHITRKLAKKLELTEDYDVQLCLSRMERPNNEVRKSERTYQEDYPAGMRKRLQRRNMMTGSEKGGKRNLVWQLDIDELDEQIL